jgi:hypothetical protein
VATTGRRRRRRRLLLVRRVPGLRRSLRRQRATTRYAYPFSSLPAGRSEHPNPNSRYLAIWFGSDLVQVCTCIAPTGFDLFCKNCRVYSGIRMSFTGSVPAFRFLYLFYWLNSTLCSFVFCGLLAPFAKICVENMFQAKSSASGASPSSDSC